MKKKLLLLIGIFLALTATAQNVEIVSGKSDKKPQKVNKNFEWISPQMNLDSVPMLGAFRVAIESHGGNGMDMSFFNLKNQAQKLGANTYLIKKMEQDSNKIIVLVNVYWLNRAQMLTNLSYYKRNFVTLIGEINSPSPQTQNYFVNGVADEIAPFTYKSIENKAGTFQNISLKQNDDAPLIIHGTANNLGAFITHGEPGFTLALDMKIGSAAHSLDSKKKRVSNGMILYKLSFARFAMDVLDFIQEKQINF